MPSKYQNIMTQLSVWGSIASLVGLVIYFLPPSQPTRKQNQSAAAGGQVIHAENSTVTVVGKSSEETSTQTQPTKTGDFIALNYMRLFGAIEVPLLMDLMGRKLAFQELEAAKHYYKFSSESKNIASDSLVNFWKNQWRYKDASPLRTNLWTKFQGKHEAGIDLYFTSLRPRKEDVLSFATHSDIDESGSDSLPVFEAFGLTRDPSWKPTGIGTEQIGFIFVIVESQTASRINSIELEFATHSNPLRSRHYEKDSPIELSRLAWPDPQAVALTDAMIENRTSAPQTERLKIASARPGESFIWLLAAYVANADGLPLHYMTDVTVPLSVTAEVDGKQRTQQLRKPYLLQAARVTVPNGWFGQ